MAERSITEALVAAGLTAEQAAERIDQVFAGVKATLLAGKTVGIPGVCRLKAPLKPAWLPGFWKKKAVMQRKVAMQNAAVIERGEPYDV